MSVTSKKNLSVVKITLDLSKINKVKNITKAQSYDEAIDNALKIVIDNNTIHRRLLSIRGKGKIQDVYNRLQS
ncbi:MAG: hypothetical protein N3A62_01515 [Thermodesulfovibrionales bacterium]|nr:hypothetical protein [Thermodesulfovibrionales bacterium]